MENKDIQIKEKKEALPVGEFTHEGPLFIPSVDIFEDGEKIVLIADMPGVKKENVELRVEDGELHLRGVVEQTIAGDYVLSEYLIGNYERTFTLSDVIDQKNIGASMKNGVLRLTLPKASPAQPKKITINI